MANVDSSIPSPPDLLVPFVKLKAPSTYCCSHWDMRVHEDARRYWVPFAKKHFPSIIGFGSQMAVDRGEAGESVRARVDACTAAFHARLDRFAADPHYHEPVRIMTLDRWRDELLRAHGFADAFQDLKRRENEAALRLLPAVCAQVDTLHGDELFRAVVEGVFAGNIFDMGAAGSAALLRDGKLDFFSTRSKLPPRPWLVDEFDAFMARARSGWKKAVFFVDNAGSDFVLGAVPMIRHLARRGTAVVLAANERPTLNDMTIAEVTAWWPRLRETEPTLAGLPITFVSTGTADPLIDLSRVSPALNEAAAAADLVVLEGMGRGVQSNLHAAFTCDAANLAMVKDQSIADWLNGKMYDVVCRYR